MLHLQEQEGFGISDMPIGPRSGSQNENRDFGEDFAVNHDYNPIHHIERRLKTPDSIEEACATGQGDHDRFCQKKIYFDIAGISWSAISLMMYAIADMLTSQAMSSC